MSLNIKRGNDKFIKNRFLEKQVRGKNEKGKQILRVNGSKHKTAEKAEKYVVVLFKYDQKQLEEMVP